MPSIRTIRKNHKTRTFISKFQRFGDGDTWGPYRHGLRYGDVRSHQKRRHVGFFSPGVKDLIDLPTDPIHRDREVDKRLRADDIRRHKKYLLGLKVRYSRRAIKQAMRHAACQAEQREINQFGQGVGAFSQDVLDMLTKQDETTLAGLISIVNAVKNG